MYWPIYILMLILVCLSAFFSSSEISFATSNKLRIRNTAESGDKTARISLTITDNFPRFLATVLVGNNLVNIAFSSAFTTMSEIRFAGSANLIAGVGSTVILLIFGEIVPKIVGASQPDTLVRRFSRPIRLCMVVFAPVVTAVNALVSFLSPLWTPKTTQPSVTDEELVDILMSITDEGVITEREGDLIKSAIGFSDVTAREILVPRVDLAAYDIEDDPDTLLHDREVLSYSRIPVYEGSIDNIIGILSTKKLIKTALSGTPLDIRAMLTPPIFVHMTKTISSILKDFRNSHSQMAVVVDEFGGTMGILTLEDVMEEIVGEIYDESDEIEHDIVRVGENSFEVDGGMNIEDMFDFIDYTPRDFDSDYTTVGGWAVEMLDRFPAVGDKFDYEALTVTVLEAESMRVEKLRVEIRRDADESGNGEDAQ